MLREPLVSIGLSCYNVEKYVEFAINSIIKQTYKNWELIVIDDNSSDDTYLKLKKYEGTDRIKLIKDEKNEGLSKRLNQLIELSEGEYFLRMDADDVMDINRIKVQVEFLIANPDIDVLGSEAYIIDDKNHIEGLRKTHAISDVRSVVRNCAFIHPTVIGKLSWFKKHKYNEKCLRIEDYELWVRTIHESKFFVLREPLLFYRELGQNSINKYSRSKLNSFRIVKSAKNLDLRYKIFFLIKEYFKIVIFSALYFLKQENFLIKERSFKLDSLTKKKAEERLLLALN